MGGLTIRSHAQRFREGAVDSTIPEAITGTALLHETYDDEAGCFRIQVDVSNDRFGPLCGYRGTFTCRWPSLADGAPAAVKPLREERRL